MSQTDNRRHSRGICMLLCIILMVLVVVHLLSSCQSDKPGASIPNPTTEDPIPPGLVDAIAFILRDTSDFAKMAITEDLVAYTGYEQVKFQPLHKWVDYLQSIDYPADAIYLYMVEFDPRYARSTDSTGLFEIIPNFVE